MLKRIQYCRKSNIRYFNELYLPPGLAPNMGITAGHPQMFAPNSKRANEP
jgi:hypothetical protein